MSGFTGIIHLDGADVDAILLKRMTRLAEKHGGGRFNTRCLANAGFGHSLLQTSPESATEEQPFSFDDTLWIVGDARLDDRKNLVAALQAKDRSASLSQADIELVLHAFCAWGERCVENFYGDFSVAVWDTRKYRLFCARDSFGIKPFYYAHSGSTIVFSNNLDSIRCHPGISDALNQAVIGDYLATGLNLDQSASFFNDIARLPPAHTLMLEADHPVQTRAYQRLHPGNRIRYPNTRDYRDHFLELFSQAVSDRLRSNRVGFELSGGLDSTSVAVMAARLGKDIAGFSGTAVTTDNSRSDPHDQEARYAGMVAQYCGFEHQTIEPGSSEDFYAYCKTAQPMMWPFSATSIRFAQLVREHGRVLLSGQGGDPCMSCSGFKLLDDYRELSLPSFVLNLIKASLHNKSLRGHGLQGLLARNSARIPLPEMPGWLNNDFLRRAGTIERWHELYYRANRYPPGCDVELAWDELHMPDWTHLFENYYHDLFCGIDCRHPWFDIRLINFLLAIPASIKHDKWLLRESMQGTLPEPVRSRPKSVVINNLIQSRLNNQATYASLDLSLEHCTAWIDKKAYLQALDQYARGKKGDFFTILCPLNLEQWFK